MTDNNITHLHSIAAAESPAVITRSITVDIQTFMDAFSRSNLFLSFLKLRDGEKITADMRWKFHEKDGEIDSVTVTIEHER